MCIAKRDLRVRASERCSPKASFLMMTNVVMQKIAVCRQGLDVSPGDLLGTSSTKATVIPVIHCAPHSRLCRDEVELSKVSDTLQLYKLETC